MRHDLLFLNPEIQPGLNVTVRNGRKWQTARVGEYLDVIRTEDRSSVCDALVAAVIPINLSSLLESDVLDNWLPLEHDPECRTFGGLQVAMNRAYPEGWGPELTIVVFYEV